MLTSFITKKGALMETALFDFVKGGTKIAKVLTLILESPRISSLGIYLFFMILGAYSRGGGFKIA